MAEELKVSSESSAPAQPVLALAQPEQKKKQESDFPFAVSVGDVNVAAEFIYMAAVLIHIKSKMLLPRDPDAPAAEDDPRSELVNRLLEHEKFKSAAQMLLQKQQIEDAVRHNPAIKEFMDAEGTDPEIAADVIELVKTFQQILERARSRPIIQVDEETVTVGQMIEYLQRRLALEDRPLSLKQILRNVDSRQALVCMFLALLELVRLQAIQLRQDRLFGEILLRKHVGFEAIMAEQTAVRDDWRCAFGAHRITENWQPRTDN